MSVGKGIKDTRVKDGERRGKGECERQGEEREREGERI